MTTLVMVRLLGVPILRLEIDRDPSSPAKFLTDDPR